jgi:hypothetical protein
VGIFFSLKVGQLYQEEREERKFDFFWSVLTIFISFSQGWGAGAGKN